MGFPVKDHAFQDPDQSSHVGNSGGKAEAHLGVATVPDPRLIN
jgi:hypothetical protein